MKIIENAEVSDLLWYKIGGTVRYLLEASSKEDILQALTFVKEKNLSKFFICGIGANIIFPDGFYEGAVIRLIPGKEKQIKLVGETKIEAFAGELLGDVISTGLDIHLKGLEWAGGLPGTVGAAIRGNVGAFGGEIKDVVDSVEVVYTDSDIPKVERLRKEELQFAYRSSIIKTQKNMLVLSARFALKPASHHEIEKAKEEYFDHIAYRKENHPNSFPNSGSVFKNITDKTQVEKILVVFPDLRELSEKKWYGKVSMGYLNRKLGFENFQIGGAKVSEQHANFIDNIGGAKADDVIGIIRAIQEKFQEKFGFTPEPEVEIVT